MARPPRCLVPDVDAPSPQLDAPSRHHVERVLRLREGDVLELVDGRGGLAVATLQREGRLAIVSRATREPEPRAPLWLAVAPPRPSRLDWLVEKAVELGVTRILLVQTRHAARGVDGKRLERLRRIADEALLQCRRLQRVELRGGLSLDDVLARDADVWLADAPPEDDAPERLDAAPPERDERGDMGRRPEARATRRAADRPLLLLVGPEGGFHADEIAAADARGARHVRCGRGVLRVETAALALAVLADA
ncbi:MAG: 16S rRNA (uracil(1498)-N(3))-methyltransferase [Planctomycetes bacterium]|nr:16S rRNA (uracil(1498)-N(3))-methyltransferase [Planctomycetota bacterium]